METRGVGSRLLSCVPGLNERSVMGDLCDPAAILRKARLTVCHGGNGTVYQSLQADVPVLCLAYNPGIWRGVPPGG